MAPRPRLAPAWPPSGDVRIQSGFTAITHLQDVFILVLSVQLPGRGQQTWGRDSRRETWAPRPPRATLLGGKFRVTFKSQISILLVFGQQEHLGEREGEVRKWKRTEEMMVPMEVPTYIPFHH